MKSVLLLFWFTEDRVGWALQQKIKLPSPNAKTINWAQDKIKAIIYFIQLFCRILFFQFHVVLFLIFIIFCDCLTEYLSITYNFFTCLFRYYVWVKNILWNSENIWFLNICLCCNPPFYLFGSGNQPIRTMGNFSKLPDNL